MKAVQQMDGQVFQFKLLYYVFSISLLLVLWLCLLSFYMKYTSKKSN